MKLALGTVQFGLNYGINNSSGQVTEDEVSKILTFAKDHNLTYLDTARAYGNSEEVLGKNELHDFQLISKVAANAVDASDVYKSLQNLGIKKIYGYLFHSFESYQKNPFIFDELVQLKDEGIIEKIGFSLYQPSELEYLMSQNIQFDLIQIPFNLLDKRFYPLIKKYNHLEVHVRSVFLQGLFFKPLNDLPIFLKPLQSVLEKLHTIAQNLDISMLQLALSYVNSIKEIDKLVLGVDTLDQLKSSLENYSTLPILPTDITTQIDNIIIEHQDLLIPSNWK